LEENVSGQINPFFALSKTTTPTSPNSGVDAISFGDPNSPTQITFNYQSHFSVWTSHVSPAQPQAVLGADITVKGVTWKAGITVQYSTLDPTHSAVTIVSGEIIEDGDVYSVAGLTLLTFPVPTPTLKEVACPSEV
jgi:hypothetical protein